MVARKQREGERKEREKEREREREREREKYACALELSRSLLSGPWSVEWQHSDSGKVFLPPLVSPLWKHCHRHTQKCALLIS
jgi:hypothetical protein